MKPSFLIKAEGMPSRTPKLLSAGGPEGMLPSASTGRVEKRRGRNGNKNKMLANQRQKPHQRSLARVGQVIEPINDTKYNICECCGRKGESSYFARKTRACSAHRLLLTWERIIGHTKKKCPMNLDKSFDMILPPGFRCHICGGKGSHLLEVCSFNEAPDSLAYQHKQPERIKESTGSTPQWVRAVLGELSLNKEVPGTLPGKAKDVKQQDVADHQDIADGRDDVESDDDEDHSNIKRIHRSSRHREAGDIEMANTMDHYGQDIAQVESDAFLDSLSGEILGNGSSKSQGRKHTRNSKKKTGSLDLSAAMAALNLKSAKSKDVVSAKAPIFGKKGGRHGNQTRAGRDKSTIKSLAKPQRRAEQARNVARGRGRGNAWAHKSPSRRYRLCRRSPRTTAADMWDNMDIDHHGPQDVPEKPDEKNGDNE